MPIYSLVVYMMGYLFVLYHGANNNINVGRVYAGVLNQFWNVTPYSAPLLDTNYSPISYTPSSFNVTIRNDTVSKYLSMLRNIFYKIRREHLRIS